MLYLEKFNIKMGSWLKYFVYICIGKIVPEEGAVLL